MAPLTLAGLWHNVLMRGSWRGWDARFENAAAVESVFALNDVAGDTELSVGQDEGLWRNMLTGGQWQKWEPNFRDMPARAQTCFAVNGRHGTPNCSPSRPRPCSLTVGRPEHSLDRRLPHRELSYYLGFNPASA